MTAINRFINILTSALRPIRLYVGGSGGSGGISFGSNLNLEDLNINLDDLSTGHEIVKPYDNANYSSDARQGSVNTKPQTSEVIDTTKYDARIKDLQAQIDAIGWIGPTTPTPNYGKHILGTTPEEANRNLLKKQQKEELERQLKAAEQEKSDYINNATKGIGYTDLDENTTQASQALLGQQQSEAATAQANKTANINAGINKSRAGMLGSQKASTDNSVAQNQYMSNRFNAASTQADYLEKMAQADALDQYASNMSKSAGLAALSGAFQGAGSGAALGAVISDESMKERATETFEPDRDFGKKGQHETWYTHPANNVYYKDGKAYRDTIQQSTGMTAADKDNPNNGYSSRWGRNDGYVRNLTKYISDENMKEDPIDDNKLQEAITEFKRLSERIKQLKGERK